MVVPDGDTVIDCPLILPGFQCQLVAPLVVAVKVAEFPAQMLGLLTLLIVGVGLTVTVPLAVTLPHEGLYTVTV